jgi:hypothetical protein
LIHIPTLAYSQRIDYIPAMTAPHSLARPRTLTPRNPLGRYIPKAVSEPARWRFTRDRREGYLRRIGGAPDERQALIITQMIDAEWQAWVCERKAAEANARVATEALRLAAEFRRQLMLLDRDLARTTTSPAAMKAKTGVPQLSLDEHLAMLRQRQEGAT